MLGECQGLSIVAPVHQITPTWDTIVQPPDEKQEVICFYAHKYAVFQRGLELLLERIHEVNERAKTFGLTADSFDEDESYVRQMVKWGKEKLAKDPGLVEERSSIRSIRYLKAGISVLIIQERNAAPTGLPARLLQEWNDKIAKLESLAEEKQLKNLKPADIFFELFDTNSPGTEASPKTSTSSATMNSQPPHSARLLMYCYCHEDKALRDGLEKHLSAMRHDGLIAEWHDRKILAGAEWEKEIDKRLDTAAIILLLVTASFLNSRYCYSVEMKRALDRHENGECRVIPVILRDCDWQSTPLGKLQALPSNGKAVTGRGWKNTHEAFADVARRLREVVETVN